MIDRGCGKYDYVAELGWQFPCVDFNEDGTPHETPHHTCFISDWEAEDVLQQLGMTDKDEQRFYKQESIIPVIEAFGLDKEKFWYAVVYVALLTKLWSEQKKLHDKPLLPAYDQLKKLRNEIVRCKPERCPKEKNVEEIQRCKDCMDCIRFSSCHEFRVVFESQTESHSVEMAGNHLMCLLAVALTELMEQEVASGKKNAIEIPVWRQDKSTRTTEMTWYAANMFKLLLQCLKVPVLRSRGKKAGVSYDKNQLIAELIHFLDLTDNPDLDGNSIKSILNSEREFRLGIF